MGENLDKDSSGEKCMSEKLEADFWEIRMPV